MLLRFIGLPTRFVPLILLYIYIYILYEKFEQKINEIKAERSAAYVNYGDYFSLPYDGEKNLGEIGPVKSYWMNFPRLRARSWQSYAESEITRTIIGRFVNWVVGSGLRLQCKPEYKFLGEEKIQIDSEEFSSQVERRFRLFMNSKKSTASQMMSVNALSAEVLKAALIGGDVLVRLYYTKGKGVKVQLIDGANVQSMISTGQSFPNILDNGNELRYGVEISPEGMDVAYYLTNRKGQYERVPARSESGHEVAFLVKGAMYRPQDCRGIPLISVVLETLAKLERYKEATVGSAEERAKIPFFIEHGNQSTGENPFIKGLAEATRGGIALGGNADGRLPQTIEGEQLANKVYASVNKQTFNMPIGSKISVVDTKSDLHFAEFYNKNIDIICAALGIPPDVAFSKYENSYSSSRAALKDWEHTLKVERDKLAEQFYKKIYEFWLFVNVFEGKIIAPGYTEAILNDTELIVEAYSQSRFIGDNVPHIDPLKEVQAERLKMGALGANIPLTTVEDATEALNSGDANSNIRQFANEFHEAEELGLVTPTPPTTIPSTPSKPVEEDEEEMDEDEMEDDEDEMEDDEDELEDDED